MHLYLDGSVLFIHKMTFDQKLSGWYAFLFGLQNCWHSANGLQNLLAWIFMSNWISLLPTVIETGSFSLHVFFFWAGGKQTLSAKLHITKYWAICNKYAALCCGTTCFRYQSFTVSIHWSGMENILCMTFIYYLLRSLLS